MTWVKEFIQSLLVEFKFATNYVYMVIDDNWTYFCVFLLKNSGHKG